MPSAPLTIGSLSRFFQYALAISAWKQVDTTRWSLRCNPSSGNLHPTEGYLLTGALPGLGDAPGLYHYAPREHGLERRAVCGKVLFEALMREFPAHALLIGLSSIHWREAWKYGERAFRYCQHDVGHAIGTLRVAAATLGWSAALLHGLADQTIEDLLGLNRAEDFAGAEREHPDAVLAVWPTHPAKDAQGGAQHIIARHLDPALAHQMTRERWQGAANRLSRDEPVAGRSSTKSRPQRANRQPRRKGLRRVKLWWSGAAVTQAPTGLRRDRSFCNGEACRPATDGHRSRPNASIECSRG